MDRSTKLRDNFVFGAIWAVLLAALLYLAVLIFWPTPANAAGATVAPIAQIAPSSASDWTRPMTGVFSITPSDSTNLTYIARGVYVGNGGDVSVVALDGTTGTFYNVNSGTTICIMAKRVNSTGTTASNLLGGL